jgi:hypothetical protein
MIKLAIHLLNYMKLYMHLVGIASYIVTIHLMKTHYNMQVRPLDLLIGLFSIFFIVELEYRFLFKKIVENLKDQMGIGEE